MSEPLLVCASADPDDVAHGVAVALAYHDAPASAQGRSRISRKRKWQAGKVVPHALRYLETVDSSIQGPQSAIEAVCRERVCSAIGVAIAWWIGEEAISLIVGLLVRWWMARRANA